jgi:hypothetical protein
MFALIVGTVLGAASPAAVAQPQPQCFPFRPTDNLTITSNFGMRMHPVRRQWIMHNGADFGVPKFTPLYAVDGGRIISSQFERGGGETIHLLTNGGIVTRYMHLERRFFREGETVRAGQQIGQSGNTGEWTTGPHLHFEVRPNGGSPVDPRGYVCGSAVAGNAGPETGPQAGTDPSVPSSAYPDPSARPSASMPSWEGKSLHQVLASETERRFLSPQWRRDITDPLDVWRNDPRNAGQEPPDMGGLRNYLLHEITIMLTLSNLVRTERKDLSDRIAALWASLISLQSEQYRESVLNAVRNSSGTPAK